MPKLVRSQKKGKVSIYNSRFKHNAIKLSESIPKDAIQAEYAVVEFKKDHLSRVIAILKDRERRKTLHLTVPKLVPLNSKLGSSTLAYQQLKDYAPGTEICNVEKTPNGGKLLVRSAGSKALIFKHEGPKTTVILPSKKKIQLQNTCRAIKGRVCNGQLSSKEWAKAGKKFYAMRARGKKYPIVSANKMNVIDHCLGGSRRKARGRPMTVSRNRPPGAKYGCIAARRTGVKK